jgi:hypothetical protein
MELWKTGNSTWKKSHDGILHNIVARELTFNKEDAHFYPAYDMCSNDVNVLVYLREVQIWLIEGCGNSELLSFD